MVRFPAVAGMFYPSSKEELIDTIKNCFLNKEFGPGDLPKEKKQEYIPIAGIVPHAGYVYSGPCAAWLYKEIFENNHFDTIIILGTNHSGLGSKISMFVTEKWKTPLGVIDTDIEFGKYLIENSDAVEDPLPHLYEHSIEVQLPFLQFLFDNKIKIVPILLNDLSLDEIRDLVKILKKGSEELGRKIFLISSSDFTHHGYVYNYVLFNENVSENVRKLDMQYIEAILNLDSESFLDLLEKYKGTVCGVYPILAFIEYSKLFNARTKLLKYYNSGEITKDESVVVGYASIISYI